MSGGGVLFFVVLFSEGKTELTFDIKNSDGFLEGGREEGRKGVGRGNEGNEGKGRE